MKLKIILSIIIAIFIFWIFFFPAKTARYDNTLSSNQTTGAELIGGAFSLTDQSGKTVSDTDYRGKYMLVFFGFTHCPKICPLGLHTMVQTLNKLGILSDKIYPIFITVDPERDDVQRMAEYLKAFDSRLIGLTGSIEQIDKVVRSYRAYYKKILLNEKQDYTIDHSAVIYLMNERGAYVTHFTSELGADEIAKRIQIILK